MAREIRADEAMVPTPQDSHRFAGHGPAEEQQDQRAGERNGRNQPEQLHTRQPFILLAASASTDLY